MQKGSKKGALRPSLRARINDKCRECIYDPMTGGSCLEQITNCTSKACPLWQVRPIKQGVKT